MKATAPLHAAVAQLPAPLHLRACRIAAPRDSVHAVTFDRRSSALERPLLAEALSSIEARVAELVPHLPHVTDVILQLTQPTVHRNNGTESSPARQTCRYSRFEVDMNEREAATIAQVLARAAHVACATVLGASASGMRSLLTPQMRAWRGLRSLTLVLADRDSIQGNPSLVAGRCHCPDLGPPQPPATAPCCVWREGAHRDVRVSCRPHEAHQPGAHGL